ncbi:28173_t:CDS:2 [Racocetra persica]|uniref:28173_t:CDS:1 n=1 Tax=Racocetra persica TaxID=160502 RepID=A0ACA9KCH2_9GLOM|nr:28173_t:CDS:2 [Racocetra persica]
MIPPCSQCGKDDFKKTCDRKAHLKRKFKYKPKPISQIKDQVIVQDLGAKTNTLSEKCLQKALEAYFAYQDGHTEHLKQIF